MPKDLKKDIKEKMPKDIKEKISNDDKDELKKTIQKGFDDLNEMIKKAKLKYEKSDSKTKEKIKAGIVGAGAFLAGALSLHAIKKKKKK